MDSGRSSSAVPTVVQRGQPDRSRQRFLKTKLCKYYRQGHCWKGAACEFAHDPLELRGCPNLSKTKICLRYRNGDCTRRTENCPFAHSLEELRSTADCFKTNLCSFWLLGHCRAGLQCRHAHGESDLRRVDLRPDNHYLMGRFPAGWSDNPFTFGGVFYESVLPSYGSERPRCDHGALSTFGQHSQSADGLLETDAIARFAASLEGPNKRLDRPDQTMRMMGNCGSHSLLQRAWTGPSTPAPLLSVAAGNNYIYGLDRLRRDLDLSTVLSDDTTGGYGAALPLLPFFGNDARRPVKKDPLAQGLVPRRATDQQNPDGLRRQVLPQERDRMLEHLDFTRRFMQGSLLGEDLDLLGSNLGSCDNLLDGSEFNLMDGSELNHEEFFANPSNDDLRRGA